MMSYLYPEDEVTFDKSGFGPLPDMLGSYAEEEGNSYFELYFEYPLFSSHERGDYNQIYVNMSDYLIEGNQVTYKPSHSREPHAFRIYKTEKQVERGIILVWARTRTADLRGNPVRRVVSNGAPVSSALRALKLASEETHPFSFTTNIQSNISFEKTQTNVLDALAGEEDSILAITGGQMIRTNNDIYIGINESSKNIVEFRLGKNIEGISYEVDYSNVVTAVIPFYTQTYKLVDDIRDEIVRDSSGKIVKNTDGTTKYNRTVGKKRESLDNEVIVYGDTVFSQYANDYSTPFYSFVEIRDDREDPGVDKDPLPPFTKTDINNRAIEWFNWEENLGVDEPEVSVTVDVHDISQSSEYSHDINLAKLETLNVFDKALVYVPEVGIDMDMEINYIRYDGVAEKNLEVRLGTTLTSLTETVLSPQQRAFNERVQQLDREIEKSLMSSDGKSRVYWMATKPTGSFEIGDLWFDISLDGGIYVWDGYDWVAKLPPEFGKLIEDSVNEAIAAADLAMQEARSSADKALLDAKAYAEEQDRLITQQVTQSVNTAISTADAAKVAAKTNADKALAEAKAYAIAQDKLITQQVNTSVGTALSTAQVAKTAAESSYTNAVAEAERLVGVQTTAFNKKFEENATAMGTLSQAAKDADAKAQSALTKAGTNANTLTTHQTTLNTINTTTIPAVNKAAADAMTEAKKADGKIAAYVTQKGLVSGTTVDTKINTATGEITKKITALDTKKLDSTTYTNFYENDYKSTAQGVTDIYTKVNKIVDANGNTLDTFAKAVYDKNATRQSAAFTAVTKNLVTTTTYTAGINGITTRLNAIDSSDPKSLVTRLNKTESTASGNSQTIATINKNYVKQSNIDASILADKKIKDTRNANQLPSWYFSNYPSQEVREFKLVSTMGIGSGTYGILTTNVPWTEKSGGTVKQSFENNDGIHTRQGNSAGTAWGAWVKQIDTADTTYQKITQTSSLYERVIGSTEANVKSNVASIVMKDSSFQTTVANKADKTQITQLNNAIVLKADKTALSSKKDEYTKTITINGNGNTYYPLYFIKGDQSVPRVIRITRSYSAPAPGNIWNPKQPTHPGGINMEWVGNFGGWGGATYKESITSFGESYTTILADLGREHNSQSYAFYLRGGGAQYTISSDQPLDLKVGYSTNDTIWSSGSSTWKSAAPKTSVNRSRIDGFVTAQNSQITVLNDAINLRVTKGDISNQININTQGVVIQGNKIALSGDTTVDGTFWAKQVNAVKVKADKIEGTTAQFNSLRSNILTANVITSNMINANTAMFDKLFSTTSATSRLSAQDAWIKSANIVSLDASKIKTGTIDAGRLNAGAIVTAGLSANVVKSTHIESSTGLIDKIFANDALITRLTSNTIFASKIKAITIDASKITSGTIATARLNAGAIVTNGLSANVVKSTHIESSNGLIDKIFANEAYIKRMTGKKAFISSIQAISINASKITSGTLDASKVTVTNIDASSITANQANLVKAGLTSSSGGTLELSGDQLLSSASNGSQVFLQNGVMGVRRPTSEGGGTIGQIGYVYDGGSPTYTIQTSWGSHFALKQRFYDTYTKTTNDKRAIFISTGDGGETTMQFYAKDFVLQGDRNLRFGYDHYINGIGNDLTLTGKASVTVRANESTVFVVSSNGKNNYASMHANLNMQGNTVTNTSDIRLKRDIVNDELDSLSALMKWQHAGFNYINPDMNQERQFSVIAQSAPDLSFAGEDGFLQVALNKQVNMTSHALQQHVIETRDAITQLKAQIATLQKELALAKGV